MTFLLVFWRGRTRAHRVFCGETHVIYANLADYVDGNERYVLSEGSAADCSDESKIDGTGSCESGLFERRVRAWNVWGKVKRCCYIVYESDRLIWIENCPSSVYIDNIPSVALEGSCLTWKYWKQHWTSSQSDIPLVLIKVSNDNSKSKLAYWWSFRPLNIIATSTSWIPVQQRALTVQTFEQFITLTSKCWCAMRRKDVQFFVLVRACLFLNSLVR